MEIPDKTPLYQQIAEMVRRKILSHDLEVGDLLPSVRALAEQWNCTPGTVQQAYRELARQGLVASRVGQGTRVLGTLSASATQPLRRAALVHQADSFLLQVLQAGYTPAEIEQAFHAVLDRWQALAEEPASREAPTVLRFAGSHDPVVSLLAGRLPTLAPTYSLRVRFTGSLGGLIALAQGTADVAGCHLWDEDEDSYNRPFVRRLLPGRAIALLTVAHRRLGLLVAPGNPSGLASLGDLVAHRPRFVNRQRGSGTRVWLDAQLRRAGMDPAAIWGYEHEVATHNDVAAIIADGQADCGLAIEAAAQTYELEFVYLARERYDLVIPQEVWSAEPVQAVAAWLGTTQARAAINALGGYDTGSSGALAWE